MSLTFYLKNNLSKVSINPRIGKLINFVPYNYRPGIYKSYNTSKSEINFYQFLSSNERKKFILTKISTLVKHAFENTYFYKTYYEENNFNPSYLKSFDDINKIPIVDKNILQNYSIDERSIENKAGLMLANTGGSSGKPLSFYTNSYQIGHEWAHIHYFWNKLGYKPSEYALGFAGRSTIKDLVEYDFVRNKFNVDIYSDFASVKNKLIPILKKYDIKFLHGYPSAIFEFAKYCENDNGELLFLLKKKLKGVFLSSEFPHSHYRDPVEKIFGIKTQSFYGHTERCIMAYENDNKFIFETMQTYGFAELQDGYLIGTSYNSFGTPLIRYNTNDLVDGVDYNEGVLKSFKINEGRDGDFIYDINNKKIPLTGLIFGRHHKLFDVVEHIQVHQPEIGKCVILYTTNKNISEEMASEYFDSSNVKMNFTFKKLDKPIKSVSGKVLLKIKKME